MKNQNTSEYNKYYTNKEYKALLYQYKKLREEYNKN